MHNFGPPELIDTLPRYPRVNFVHTLTRAIDYQDRPEYAELCKWWRQGGGGVCALVGIGGAGKTALAERILRVLPGMLATEPLIPKDPTLPVPEALFLFSFYQVPNPQVFFAQLSTWLGGEALTNRLGLCLTMRPSHFCKARHRCC